jgi:serine/threonine-protein kinase
MTGQTVSHYEILEPLGRGGMGVVYKAKDLDLDRVVAIKFLPPHIAATEAEKRRFVQEARTASAFDHPNICTIHEIGSAPDGQLFIVMAFYEGETLKARIAAGHTEPDRVRDIAAQVAQALGKAHAKGIVHRDIKPANIIVTADGVAKVLDFGLAKLGGGDATVTAPGIAAGTVAYMAPEQIRGEADHRCDLWALGIVLYEMFTGRTPFQGDRTESLLLSILHDPVTPVRLLRPDVPDDLARVIERCLQKNPADRYDNAGQILADLRMSHQVMQPIPPADGSARWRAGASVIVLPFVNMSRDEQSEYFSDGLTEELIHALAQVEGLRVVSRTTAFEFKGKALDVRTIGERLKVGTVLEGGVRRSGDRLRVTAQLTNTADGYQIWSQRFDRELKDIFAIQDDIAATVVDTLKLKLRSEQPAERRHGGNLESYNLYLKGRFHWNKQTAEGFHQAIQCLEQAIAVDENYAPAHAALADIYMSIGFWGVMPPAGAWAKAREAAQKAIAIDPASSEAHTALARCAQFNDWNRREAERGLRLAVDLNPNYGDAQFALAVYHAQMGELRQALESAKRARDLDPLNPLIGTGVAWMLYYRDEIDRAIEECSRVLGLQPEYFEAQGLMGLLHEAKGKPADSVRWFEKARDASGGSPAVLGFLGRAYAASGRTEDAEAVLQRLRDLAGDRYVPPVAYALVYIGLGDRERALDWLEAAYEARDPFLCYAKVFPPYDRLRAEPRFKALLERMGLEHGSRSFTSAR